LSPMCCGLEHCRHPLAPARAQFCGTHIHVVADRTDTHTQSMQKIPRAAGLSTVGIRLLLHVHIFEAHTLDNNIRQ